MACIKTRLLISNIVNIIMTPLFLSAFIVEIVDITKNPNSVIKNFWGIFRYFSYDGSIISVIISIIMLIKNCKALKMQIEEENLRDKALSHFIDIISLISACNEFVIFLIAIIIIIYTISTDVWNEEFKTSYKTLIIHEFIPIFIAVRSIFDVRKTDLKLYEKFVGGLFITIYLIIIIPLCAAKVFTSFDKNKGDGNIPYPFFDFYHERWYVCLIISLLLILLAIGFGFLIDFLNKKVEIYLISRESLKRIGTTERLSIANEKLFVESIAHAY